MIRNAGRARVVVGILGDGERQDAHSAGARQDELRGLVGQLDSLLVEIAEEVRLVAARWENWKKGVPDVLWNSRA